MGNSVLLKNTIAIVTGATRGIGKAIVEQFAAEGASIAAVGRSDELARLSTDVTLVDGARLATYQGDVRDEAFLQEMVRSVRSEFGKIETTTEEPIPETENQLRRLTTVEEPLVWRDTMIVRGGQEIRLRSRSTDFIGNFVRHCHILDLEDDGMVQLVEALN